MSIDLSDQTALELKQLYADGRASPVGATEAALGRIRSHDPAVNAFSGVREEDAMAQACRSEERWRREIPAGRLEGVPVAVKDVFNMRGWPNRKGSATTPAEPVGDDAPAVAVLKRHGAIITGRTTTPEFGWKATTDSALCGVTRNPWDPERTPGGSSGGSGAAVALGMAPLALGTDAGGSVRIPASFCGVVGHKPTHELAPMWPPSIFAPLGHVGAIGWTVGDVTLLVALLAEANWLDATTPRPAEGLLAALEDGVRGLRIAFAPTLGDVPVDREVAAAVAEAADVFEEMGALVEMADPDIGDRSETFHRLYASGAANALRDHSPEERKDMDPGLVALVEEAQGWSMLDYLAAMNDRMSLIDHMEGFHRRYDLLLTPTVPIPPFEAGRDVPEDWPKDRWTSWTPFTWPFNLTGQPAISVPCGFTQEGLPVGLQIVGPRQADRRVLAAGHSFQSARPLTGHRPPMFGPRVEHGLGASRR
ncbi:amidase [Caenispirillum salinarum]|uniref:amidase n=1 Tax=Caenispirillum salinarum TaxID=859058 RepID=UPI00384B2C55